MSDFMEEFFARSRAAAKRRAATKRVLRTSVRPRLPLKRLTMRPVVASNKMYGNFSAKSARASGFKKTTKRVFSKVGRFVPNKSVAHKRRVYTMRSASGGIKYFTITSHRSKTTGKVVKRKVFFRPKKMERFDTLAPVNASSMAAGSSSGMGNGPYENPGFSFGYGDYATAPETFRNYNNNNNNYNNDFEEFRNYF